MRQYILTTSERDVLEDQVLRTVEHRLQTRKTPQVRAMEKRVRDCLELGYLQRDYSRIVALFKNYCRYKITIYIRNGSPSAEKIIENKIRRAVHNTFDNDEIRALLRGNS